MKRDRLNALRRSIACRISLLLLITVLTPTVIVQMHLAARYEENMEQYVQSYMVNAFEGTFNGVERCFDEIKAQANYLFSAPALVAARKHPFQGYDRILMEDHRQITLAFASCSRIFPDAQTDYTYLLEDGRIFGTWGTLPFPAQPGWLKDIQAGLPSIGGYTWFSFHDQEDQNGMRPLGPSLAVAKRLSQTPFACVMVSVSQAQFSEQFAPSEERAEHMALMLFNENGERMFASQEEMSPRLSDLVRQALKDSQRETRVFRDGSRYVMTRRLAANRWVLVHSLDDASYRLYGGELGGGWLMALMIAFFVCLTAVMLTVVFRTTNGVKRLDAAVRHFSNDQKPRLLPVNGVDEVATLTYHFNLMQERIQQLMSQAQEDEKEKVRLYYEAQIAEISPHFLYNTLNSIKWTAIFSKAQNVADLISDLGALLEKHTSRYGEILTMEETLDTLDHYMNLQYARFGERVRLEKHIPPEALPLMVPKFCIQPLVENSLLHGFEQQQRKGTVRVSIELMKGYMLLLVQDDGVGMTLDRMLEVERELSDASVRVKRRSIGLQNVHRRIRYLYGSAYGLAFCSMEGVGTTMRLRLPMVSRPEEEDEDVPGSHY